MAFDTVLIPPRRAASIAQGLWHDRTINDDLEACAAEHPDKLALTALQVESGALRRRRPGAFRTPAPSSYHGAVGNPIALER